jgi:hypothetical protein
MSGLKPFWQYYGGKWRAAPRYPKPRHGTIIEPFAGAAGYSLRYPDRQIILVEKYPVIAEIWRYLIGASAQEIRAIPEVDHVDDLPSCVPQGARWLIGFTLGMASLTPRNRISAGVLRHRAAGRKVVGWSSAMRERVASQLEAIRHWRVIEGDYTAAPDICATWYVDPPYQTAGKYYKHPSTVIDFAALGAWCRTMRGQRIVCENVGAEWLPFRALYKVKTALTSGCNVEAIWASDSCHPLASEMSPEGVCPLCTSS